MQRNEPWPSPAIKLGMKAGAVAGAVSYFWIGGMSEVFRGEARFLARHKQILIFTLCGIAAGANFGGTCGSFYDYSVDVVGVKIKKNAATVSSTIKEIYTNTEIRCDGLSFFKRANITPATPPAPQPEKTTVNKV